MVECAVALGLAWRDGLRRVDYRALAVALGLGAAGGAVFAWFALPLAWMIGAMVATCAAAVAGLRVAVPKGLRVGFIMVLGILLGSAFDPDVLKAIDRWLVSLAGLVGYILVSIAVGVAYLRWVVRYDRITSFFAATPGGFNQMVLIGGALGGDDRTIALNHSTRVMAVVFFVPFMLQWAVGFEPGARGGLGPAITAVPPADWALLAACAVGAPIAMRLRVPAGELIGPMVLSAAIHLAGLTESTPPALVVGVAQVVVGAWIGCRFAGTRPRAIARTMALALGLTALLLAVTVGFAAMIHALTGIGLPALILAYAPGGLAEMSLVALALGVDAAFVSTHHVVRIILIVSFAPVVFALLRRL
jgi:membrane AbrB-like protein